MHFDLTENSKDVAMPAITVYCQCLLGSVATNEIEIYDAHCLRMSYSSKIDSVFENAT